MYVTIFIIVISVLIAFALWILYDKRGRKFLFDRTIPLTKTCIPQLPNQFVIQTEKKETISPQKKIRSHKLGSGSDTIHLSDVDLGVSNNEINIELKRPHNGRTSLGSTDISQKTSNILSRIGTKRLPPLGARDSLYKSVFQVKKSKYMIPLELP